MKDLIEFILKSIVNHPEDINITEEENQTNDGRIATNYIIGCNSEDIGLIIGKKGKTIRSIRSIVKIRAIKEKKFVDVKIAEDNKDL